MFIQAAMRFIGRTINPFYHNPIISVADFNHLEGDRIVLQNAHVNIQILNQILMNHPRVHEALEELPYTLVLETVVTKDALKINVYEAVATPTIEQQQKGFRPLNTIGWAKEGVYYFSVDEAKYHLRAMGPHLVEASHPFLQIDDRMPEQSWTIPLTYTERAALGLVK